MTLQHELLLGRQKLVELRAAQARLQTEGKGLVLLIRQDLNPFEEDVSLLRTGTSLENAQRLDVVRQELQELGGRIRDLQRELGE